MRPTNNKGYGVLSYPLEEQEKHFGEIAQEIEKAQEIVISAHTNPDGDAIGSCLALCELLKHRYPEKHVQALLADSAPIPKTYKFLPHVEDYIYAADYTDTPDLFICVDLSTTTRLNNSEAVLKRAKSVVVIDHHPAPEAFWSAAMVRTQAAATGVLIQEFAEFLGEEITADIAKLLFCALVTDTGRFQYQNADPEAFAVASKLVDAGAEPSEVALRVYQSDRIEYMHLAARVMGRVSTFAHGKIAYSYATRADFENTNADPAETDGLIDIVRCVDTAEVALFLKELPDGSTRGNLRSKTDLDISGIARELGGGGHRAAAGFTVSKSIDETLSDALPLLINLFDESAQKESQE